MCYHTAVRPITLANGSATDLHLCRWCYTIITAEPGRFICPPVPLLEAIYITSSFKAREKTLIGWTPKLVRQNATTSVSVQAYHDWREHQSAAASNHTVLP